LPLSSPGNVSTKSVLNILELKFSIKVLQK
jgi:hypothetical protein